MKTRLPLLLLLALTLVALPALAQRDLGPGSPGQPKKPPAGAKETPKGELKTPVGVDKAKLDAVRDASEKLRSLPDLSCAIWVYEKNAKSWSYKNGDTFTCSMDFRVEIYVTLHGAAPASNVKLTYNWLRDGNWQRPTTNPWSHTFASIAPGTTVDAPPFWIKVSNEQENAKYQIVATIDADGTVAELNENNNTCSFEFQYLWPYPLEGD